MGSVGIILYCQAFFVSGNYDRYMGRLESTHLICCCSSALGNAMTAMTNVALMRRSSLAPCCISNVRASLQHLGHSFVTNGLLGLVNMLVIHGMRKILEISAN
jgi:hypothetical protein